MKFPLLSFDKLISKLDERYFKKMSKAIAEAKGAGISMKIIICLFAYPISHVYCRPSRYILSLSLSHTGDMKVSLLGHSAGGWLARVYMSEYGIDDIAMLLSLGTPHL